MRGCGALLCALLFATSTQAAARREQIEQFEVQMRTLNYDQALRTAQELLAQATAAQPPRAQDVVEAHLLIGRAQAAQENMGGAETSFTTALRMAEQQLGPSNPKIVDALANLGFLYAQRQHHVEAIPLLERALVLNRRNAGLYDLSQARMLGQLGESYTAVGAPLEAQRHEDYLLSMAEHAYGAKDARTVPTLCYVADWYSRVGNGNTARALYRRAIDLVERTHGKRSPDLVKPLQGLATTYTRELSVPRAPDEARRDSFQTSYGPPQLFPDDDLSPQFAAPRTLNSEGENALQRAVHILERPSESPRALRDALIVLADWFQIKADLRKSLPFYQRAAAMKGADDTELLESKETLQTPILLYYPIPLSANRYPNRREEELDTHSVLVEFTVDEKGDVTEPKIIDNDAGERAEKQTLAALGKARYRPRFVDGQPVATPGVRYRQTFKALKKTSEGS